MREKELEQGWDVAQLVDSLFNQYARSSGYEPQLYVKLGMMVHGCNSSIQEVEAAVQGHPQLYSKLETSLGYLTPFSK